MKNNSIPITKPTLDSRELMEIGKVLDSGWITQGPKVKDFERLFSKYIGNKYSIAVSNCTTALHLALKVIGVKKDDEVITVSHSYVATANSIRYCGAIPVFIDIDIKTYNMDHRLIESAITDKTKAILCVHQMGMPCNIQSIQKIAKKHNIPLVEDAACAIGSEIFYKGKWEKIGKPHGDISCFSFHPRKVLTTGEGGMITTDDKILEKKFRLLRHHGMSVSDLERHDSKNLIFEDHIILGYNYRLTDIQAAIGIAQLKKVKNIISKRRKIANRYFEILKDIEEIILPVEPDFAKSNWQSFCIRFCDNLERNKIMQHLKSQNISTKTGIMCSHLDTVYKIEPWRSVGELYKSKKARDQTLLLPLFNDLKYETQKHIGSTLKNIIKSFSSTF